MRSLRLICRQERRGFQYSAGKLGRRHSVRVVACALVDVCRTESPQRCDSTHAVRISRAGRYPEERAKGPHRESSESAPFRKPVATTRSAQKNSTARTSASGYDYS